MVARITKHGESHGRRWVSGKRVPRITKKHKVAPDPERYLKHAPPTSLCIEIEDDLTRLEKAAFAKDAVTFERILCSLNWETRSSLDFLRAIHLALSMGAYTVVQRISALGKEYYPDDEQIQKYAHVLAPPRVTSKEAPSDPTIRANRDWLMTHGDEYRGKWVGLRNGELLDSNDSFDELIARIGDEKDILITTVF